MKIVSLNNVVSKQKYSILVFISRIFIFIFLNELNLEQFSKLKQHASIMKIIRPTSDINNPENESDFFLFFLDHKSQCDLLIWKDLNLALSTFKPNVYPQDSHWLLISISSTVQHYHNHKKNTVISIIRKQLIIRFFQVGFFPFFFTFQPVTRTMNTK